MLECGGKLMNCAKCDVYDGGSREGYWQDVEVAGRGHGVRAKCGVAGVVVVADALRSVV